MWRYRGEFWHDATLCLGYEMAMKKIGRVLLWLTLFAPVFALAQIDPVKRDLIQFGYNQALEGHAPFAGYAFYYHNQPDFLRTNLTLRLALAPVYLDSELGFVGGLGRTRILPSAWRAADLPTATTKSAAANIFRAESFTGHGGEISASVYHLFNPADEIPLNLIVRGTAHYSTFERNDSTAQFPTAVRPRRIQRAHRPALGRHRADAVPGAGDGIVRLV
jgi:hypothetical protein